MLVMLGETRLDSPGCIERLETVFMGYADFPPAAFVLCGDFISPDYGNYPADKVSTPFLLCLRERFFSIRTAR